MLPGTRDRIFQAAVELFALQGFHGTSIRQIARQAGIKESSLYNHFPGKERLRQAVLDFYRQAMDAAIPDHQTMEILLDQSTSTLAAWSGAMDLLQARFHPLMEPVTRFLFNEMHLDAACRCFVLDYVFATQKRITATLLASLIQRGLIRPCDPELTASHYVCLVHGLGQENRLRLAQGEESEALKARMTRHIQHFVQGLG